MIEFDCPSCGTPIRARDDLAGRAGKCRSCGQRLVVPGPPAATLADDGDDVYQKAATGARAGADAVSDEHAAAAGVVAAPAGPSDPGNDDVATASVPQPMSTTWAVPPEPWYYGFLDSYGQLLVWGGITLGVLIAVGGFVMAVQAAKTEPGVGAGHLAAGFVGGAALVLGPVDVVRVCRVTS